MRVAILDHRGTQAVKLRHGCCWCLSTVVLLALVEYVGGISRVTQKLDVKYWVLGPSSAKTLNQNRLSWLGHVLHMPTEHQPYCAFVFEVGNYRMNVPGGQC